MAIDLNSEDARLIRGLIPINTLPGFQFDELCASHEVSSIEDGEELFTQDSADTDYYFLLEGAVFLEAGKTEVDTVNAGTDAARFALAHHIPRKVTCIAQESVRCLKVDSEMFSQETVSDLLQKSDLVIDENDHAKEEIIPFLLKAPLFRQLFVSVLPGISACLEEVNFEAGQTVIEQGQQNSKFYVIQDGSCQVTHRPFENAKEIQLDDLQQGDAFGEYALLMGGTTDITVKTITDCVMYSIGEDDFEQWIKQPLMSEIDWKDADQSGDVFLDIQQLDNYRKTHVKGSINYPFASLRVRMGQLAESDNYIVVSDDEKTSMTAVIMLRQQQLQAKVLTGGLGAVPEGSLDHILIADPNESNLDAVDSENISIESNDTEEVSVFAPVIIGSPIKKVAGTIDNQSSSAENKIDEALAEEPQSVLVEAAKEIDDVYNSAIVAEGGDEVSLMEEDYFDANLHIKKLENKLQDVWKAYKKTRGQLHKSKRRYSACYREYTRIEQSYHGMLLDSTPDSSGEIKSDINPAITVDQINERLHEEFSQLTGSNKKLKLQINRLKHKLEESKQASVASTSQSSLNHSGDDKEAQIENESLHIQINELERAVQLLEQKKSSQQMKAEQYGNENSKLRQLIQQLAKQAIDEQSQDHVLSSFDFSTELEISDNAYDAELKSVEQIKDELFQAGELVDESDNRKTAIETDKARGFGYQLKNLLTANRQQTKTWISIIGSMFLTALLVALIVSTEKGQQLLQQIGF
ncbi:MAG: cyclic nucleotide-binding domain-containing protein [Methylococcales bacterium]